MKNVAMYLAGSIKKGHEKTDESYWTDADMQLLKDGLKSYRVTFLNPAFRTDDLSNNRSVFGRDMLQVFCSDLVFVDARDRRGLGVGAEMMWAKLNRIPVLTWAPKDSHYHKTQTTVLGVSVDNFLHPFVDALSDKIVETLEEGAQWIDNLMNNPSISIKGIEQMGSAMEYYKDNQFHQDGPMRQLILASEPLKQRVEKARAQTVGSDHRL
jgi:hypothetical protein